MKRTRHCLRIGLFALALSCLPPAHASSGPEHKVEELPYGVALYHFFQQKYFSSIIELLAAKQQQTLEDGNRTAELLLGGLYLSYGMPQTAHGIFDRITRNESGQIPEDILARARFQIGKAHYADGDLAASKHALLAIGSSQLAPEYEAERLYMLAGILMRSGRYDEAMQLLDEFPHESAWKEYTRFNLGVRLIANDRLYEGALLLEKLAASPAAGGEAGALRDRARLALAATHAKLDQPQNAARYLENISLGSSRSDAALLGLGWLRFRTDGYDEALQLWMELAGRHRLNGEVLEARLLLPRVLEKQGEADLALAGYGNAVRLYTEQMASVDAALASVRGDGLSHVLEAAGADEGALDAAELAGVLTPVLGVHLVELLASADFTRAIGGYRELAVLHDNLARWEQTIPSLDMILEEKRSAYSNRLARVVNSPTFSRAEKMAARRDELVRQFEEQLQSNPRMLLATEEERELAALLEEVRSGVDAIGSDHALHDELSERYRFLAGLLQWQIDTDYAPRVRVLRKSMRELDQALAETDRAVASLKSVWLQAPAQHRRYRSMIEGKKARVAELKVQVGEAMTGQEDRIRAQAESILLRYRDRLEKYHERALFRKAVAYESLVRER